MGGEHLHIAVDDHLRMAYVELLPDNHGVTVAGFLWRAMRWFRARGASRRRRNTPCQRERDSRVFRNRPELEPDLPGLLEFVRISVIVITQIGRS
jgi:hypothetical protein